MSDRKRKPAPKYTNQQYLEGDWSLEASLKKATDQPPSFCKFRVGDVVSVHYPPDGDKYLMSGEVKGFSVHNPYLVLVLLEDGRAQWISLHWLHDEEESWRLDPTADDSEPKIDASDLNSIASLAAIYDQSGNALLQKQASIMDKFLINLAKEDITTDDLELLTSYATELDRTGDPVLIKEASVLDQILLTFGRPQGALEAFKKAEETEIDRLRAKYRTEGREQAYQKPKEELDKDIKIADAVKAIQEKIKEYRPLEAALSTRTCPDHPGAQMARIGEATYQCSLDKQVYNYQGGFKTMKGSTVPGGDVSGQTQALNDRPQEHMSFDTRESKLNP